MLKIPFNKPYFTGKEAEYIQDAVNRGHISGNGYYTKKCQANRAERHQTQFNFASRQPVAQQGTTTDAQSESGEQ